MIIVDTALQEREARGPADPGRHDRRRLHGARASPTRSPTACRACGWPRSTTASPSARSGVCDYAGLDERRRRADAQAEFDDAIRAGQPRRRPTTRCCSAAPTQIDVLVDVTGSVEFGAHVVLEAFRARQARRADERRGRRDDRPDPAASTPRSTASILSACDGDEPGLQMNLVRWVQGLGLTPRVIGNVKGLQDPYRNPTTQQGFAEQWGQNPAMVTSFADGSKISFEQTIVANATGLQGAAARHVARRRSSTARRHGPRRRSTTSTRCASSAAIVDYTVGPAGVKVFVPRRAPRPEAAPLPEPLQDGRRARCTRSGSRTTCRTSRRRSRSRASCSSATTSRRRSAARSSRSARSPSATSRRARCSTTTACT